MLAPPGNFRQHLPLKIAAPAKQGSPHHWQFSKVPTVRDLRTAFSLPYVYGRRLISLWRYKENNKLRDWKKYIYSTYSPWAPHIDEFVVLTSLTHPTKNSFDCAANRKMGNRKSQVCITKLCRKQNRSHTKSWEWIILCRSSLLQSLVVSLKGFGAKTNWLAVNRQS
jgi:hypothetical protein